MTAKLGLTVGVLAPETIPTRWVVHNEKIFKHLPGGLYWHMVYQISKFGNGINYATERTKVVEKTIKQNTKFLFFLDSDVFLPTDALTRLISHNADIITGVYWMKCTPPQPVIYKEVGDGPIWKITPQKEPMEIGGAGLGCCLINMRVFEKFKEKGIPFFKQDFDTMVNGKLIHVNIGEDHWFFMKARELGFKIFCDTNVLCDHLDVGTGKFYPGDEETIEIAKKHLIANGKTDEINK